MPEIKTTYTLIMSESEAIALKKLLGTFSAVTKMQSGLTKEQCLSTSKMFDCLPHDEDD